MRILTALCLTISALMGETTIALAGKWRFQMDRADEGVAGAWFSRGLEDRIELPGILQDQGFGDDISPDTP